MTKITYIKPNIKKLNIENNIILSGSDNQSKYYDVDTNELETEDNKIDIYNKKSIWDD